VVIRRAAVADAAALVSLLDELGYSRTPEFVRARLEDLQPSINDAVFVAEKGGRLIGCVHVCEVRYLLQEPRAEIHAMVVAADYQGQGIGRSLIGEAELWAKTRDLQVARVGTNAKRAGAHQFYEKLGYRLEKEHRIYIKPL
jgi:GNAT superfamily N-acetyltransferase